MKLSTLTRWSFLVVAALAALPSLVRAQGPGNDNFAAATVYAGASMTISTSSATATAETGEPDPFLGGGDSVPTHSVWWKFTPTLSGFYQIDSIGSGFDTVLAVFTGSSLSALTRIAQDDDLGGSSTSKVKVYLTKGTTYRIVVDGYNASNVGLTKLQIKMVRYIPALTWQGLFRRSVSSKFDISVDGVLSLTTTNGGLVTGKLTLGGVAYPFTTALDLSGGFTIAVPRPNRTPVLLTGTSVTTTINLPEGFTADATDYMDVAFDIDAFTGHFPLAPVGAGDTALKAFLPAVAPWSATNPCPRAGRYNFMINSAGAGGYSPASVTVSTTGTCTASGNLSDGTPYTFAVPLLNAHGSLTSIGTDGVCYFSTSLYNKTGLLCGYLSFNAALSPTQLTGDASWFRQPGKAGTVFLPGGVELPTIAIYGALYTAPPANTRIDPVFNPAGACTFTGSSATFATISQGMTLSTLNKFTYTAPNTNLVSLTITPSTGLLTGTARFTGAPASSTIRAVFIHNPSLPGHGFYGYITGTTQHGIVQVRP